MDRKFNRNLSNERGSSSILSLQKQLAENRIIRSRSENVPDLADFMNDMFFGTANITDQKKSYNFTGRDCFLETEELDSSSISKVDDHEFDWSRRSTSVSNYSRLLSLDEFDSSRRSLSSKSTQEWLEEAKKMVAKSPSKGESPSRGSSPRFAKVLQNSSSADSSFDRSLSRSARRHRTIQDNVIEDILSKTAKHTRKESEFNQDPSSADSPPASTVQKWFSNILKPQNAPIPITTYNLPSDPTSPKSINNQTAPPLPPGQSTPRKSRFQNSNTATQAQQIPTPTAPPNSKRTFKSAANLTTSATNSPTRLDPQLLSPPKHLVVSAHRRSISSSTCSVPESRGLSPQRNLVESAQRRSISASSCSNDRILPKSNGDLQFQVEDKPIQDLNGYLKEQRTKIFKIMSGEMNSKAKIVLSGPSNSTSSMVAAISYAWLLENRMRADKNRANGDGNGEIVVPVMNMKRGKMWNQRQAAWLFHHVHLDANALLFSDEVDLEALMMTKRLSMLVVGEDILRTNGEVGSCCTVLTDNYCEDAYDLLQTPMLKKLLLAGILLDTQNLNVYTKSSMTRDAEAIQLLLVGAASNYRNTLFDQLMQDQCDDSFTKVLQQNYGKPPNESNRNKRSPAENSNPEVKVAHGDKNSKDTKNGRANNISPLSGKQTKTPPKAPAAAKEADSSRGKNVFFLAKWFGFGSK